MSESTSYNSRLQPVTSEVWSVAVTALNHSYNFNDPSGHNNGNIATIADNLQPNRTQSFTYDSLNRIASAQTQVSSGPDCWGESYGYDVWGNLLSSTPTVCAGPSLSVGVYTNNRITNPGITYDASGNMTSDAVHTYTYDAENRLTQVDGGSTATYLYDAEGRRVQKTAAGVSTAYVYSGDDIIAEFAPSTGGWSDYIFANGRRLARADTYDSRILIQGTVPAGASSQYEGYNFSGPNAYAGYVIQNGDQLFIRQFQTPTACGGPDIGFTDGSRLAFVATDSDGNISNMDTVHNEWHFRRFNLNAFAGKTIAEPLLLAEGCTQPGNWQIYYSDFVLVSADGTVRPIYTRDSSVSLTMWGSSQMVNPSYVVNQSVSSGDAINAIEATTYYHGDHLGSARILSSGGGWPVWSATYLPFGQEWNPQSTVNHHKFTDKERDAESGLDDFVARYYGSSLGRFLSADAPLAGQDSSDPQSWNLFSFVRNNPLNATDPDGRDCIVVGGGKTKALPGNCNGDSGGKEFPVPGTVTEHHYNPKTDSEDYTYTPDNADPNTIKVTSGTITNVTSIQDQVAFDNNSDAYAIFKQLSQMRKPMMQAIGLFAGGSAALGLTGGAACYYVCPEAGLTTLGLDAGAAGNLAEPTEAQAAHVGRILEQGGRRALQKSIRSWQRTLLEHYAKLARYREAGTPTSDIIRTINNMKGLIQAAQELLGK